MYDKILVPLDGSKLAEGVLPYARTLAKGLKIPLELLTVIDPEVIKLFINPDRGRYVDAVEQDLIRNSDDYLHAVTQAFPNPKMVTSTVKIGKAAEIIAGQASSRATLIAMSTHGRTGVTRWFLGSIADKVLHATENDMLLVRPGKGEIQERDAKLTAVVLPLDGSALAEKAMRSVIDLARKLSLEIVLLRAFALPATAFYGSENYIPDVEELTAHVRNEAKSYLDSRCEAMRAEGIENVSTILLQGDASAQIIDYAANTPDNLVAMCTHGRSGVSRWVVGSVTDRVVRHSGDPVLVIRASG